MIHRRGLFVIEVAASAAIIAVLLTTMATLVMRVVTKRQENWQRLVAHECLATLADEIRCWSFEQTAPETATTLAIPAYAARQIPQASLSAVIKSQPEGQAPAEVQRRSTGPECRVVQLSISWTTGQGRPPAMARTTIWKFR